MGIREDEVEVARTRLGEILLKAKKLELSNEEVLATRPAKKLLARTSGLFGRCALRLGLLALMLAGLYLYARWPTQETDTVKTVLRKTCATGDIAATDRVAALLYTSTSAAAQDEC